MYTRSVTEPPFRLIRNGKPTFGTFRGVPSHLDIKGVKYPFGDVPLPAIITRFLIRSTLSFNFSIGDYIGAAHFFDAKLFGFAETVFWNTKTNTKQAYRSYIGPRKRLVPIRLSNAICASFRKTRYIRISWDRRYNKISLLFSVKGDSVRCSANAAFTGRLNAPDTAEITAVTPAPTQRRCSATWLTACTIHGALSMAATKTLPEKTMDDTDGLALVSLNRAYYKRETVTTTLTGFGIVNGKKITFRIVSSSLDAADTSKCNANTLFVDGEITPLPQIYITHPFGIGKTWVIQDTESMVDLEFSPVSDHARNMNTFVITAKYHMIYGLFTGTLLTAGGEKINLKGFPGIIKDSMIRF